MKDKLYAGCHGAVRPARSTAVRAIRAFISGENNTRVMVEELQCAVPVMSSIKNTTGKK
jgi:hypothetical protein